MADRELFVYGPIQGMLQIRGEGNTAFSTNGYSDSINIAKKLGAILCRSCNKCGHVKWISGDGTLMIGQRTAVPARVCGLKGRRFTA
jgi:hypothetical protein